MMIESLGTQQRSNADRRLRKILLMGLGGSAIFHTVALAGVSYLSQNSIDDLEITAIERVEVDPEPSPTPSTKSIPSPEPKIVKPIIASVPTPVPVKIPTPKAISTPPVVKIVKSAVATKPPTSPLASVVSPQPNRVATVAPQVKAAPKPNSPPAFPDRLFTDPTPKTDRPQPQQTSPARTAIATQKVESDPPQSPRNQTPQPIATADRSTLTATTSKLAKLIPNSSTNDNPSNDEFIPSQPGNTSKLARTTERSPASNNQTNLATGNKVPQGLGNDFGATESNPSPINEDFGSGTPGNNTRIASNSKATNPSTNSNQVGLTASSSPKNPGLGSNFGGSDNPGGDNDPISGTPGNNTRIARSNSGGNGVSGTSANQTGLGGSSRRNPSLSGGNLDGNGNSNSGGSDRLGSGLPGNIATGSKNQLSIQCLRNCEIRYPDSLETSDTGKDKILLKVSVDPNGSITNAEIARSSGNPKLDRATLEGVKQMQLTAMGKPLTFRIRVSTLTSN